MPSTLFASRAPQHAAISNAPSSICILRLSAIGDCCHALALVRVIQREWPQTRITWITGKIEATLFADLPGVEVIPFDKSKVARLSRSLADPQGTQIRCPAPPAGGDAGQHRYPRHQGQGQTRV